MSIGRSSSSGSSDSRRTGGRSFASRRKPSASVNTILKAFPACFFLCVLLLVSTRVQEFFTSTDVLPEKMQVYVQTPVGGLQLMHHSRGGRPRPTVRTRPLSEDSEDSGRAADLHKNQGATLPVVDVLKARGGPAGRGQDSQKGRDASDAKVTTSAQEQKKTASAVGKRGVTTSAVGKREADDRGSTAKKESGSSERTEPAANASAILSPSSSANKTDGDEGYEKDTTLAKEVATTNSPPHDEPQDTTTAIPQEDDPERLSQAFPRCLAEQYPMSRFYLPKLLNCLGLVGKAAEIGVQRGRFSKEFLEIWKGKHLLLVDKWEPLTTAEYVGTAQHFSSSTSTDVSANSGLVGLVPHPSNLTDVHQLVYRD